MYLFTDMDIDLAADFTHPAARPLFVHLAPIPPPVFHQLHLACSVTRGALLREEEEEEEEEKEKWSSRWILVTRRAQNHVGRHENAAPWT